MQKKVILNFVVFLVFLTIPILVDYLTINHSRFSGAGFDVLIYEPFDFGYVLFVWFVFGGTNVFLFKDTSKYKVVAYSFGITLIWFVISFLALVQFHISLGGTL